MMNNLISYLVILNALLMPLGLSSMEISVSVGQFKDAKGPYIEVYSRVESESVQWIVANDTTHITSNIEYMIQLEKQGDVFLADKYILTSPLVSEQIDFWDLKRIGMGQGNYLLKLTFVDLNNVTDTLTYEKAIEINISHEQLSHSNLLLISDVDTLNSKLPFNKSGFSFEPMPFNLLSYEQEKFIFYCEVYNANLSVSDDYFLKYFIENMDKEGFDRFSKTGYKKLKAKTFEPLLISFDAQQFKSGNYKLHVELNQKDKTLIKAFEEHFSVYNPFEDYIQTFKSDSRYETSFVQHLNNDELNYALKAIFPRVGNLQTELLNQIIRNDEAEPKKYFLYHFWSAFSNDDPKSIFDDYMKVAAAVDKTYANNVGFGFESQRGYYFLKYGKPDDLIFVEDEPTAPPYEIWIYNYIAETQQTNVRFLFYNPSLVTNDYILLHSTCRGERNNPRWELELYSDAYQDLPSNFIDGRQLPDGYHRNARKIFDSY